MTAKSNAADTSADTADTKATAAAGKTMYATRLFTDAGTERSFGFGDTVEVDDGTMSNYKAAGLVSAEKPQAADPAA